MSEFTHLEISLFLRIWELEKERNLYKSVARLKAEGRKYSNLKRWK